EELGRLIRAGLPVPRMTELLPALVLAPATWGEFVVVKPELSYRALGIRLVRTDSLASRYAELSQGGRERMIVQSYVENLDDEGRQHEFRVLTMFGRPLYAVRKSATGPRRPLAELAADPAAKINVNAADGSTRRTSDDPDVL